MNTTEMRVDAPQELEHASLRVAQAASTLRIASDNCHDDPDTEQALGLVSEYLQQVAEDLSEMQRRHEEAIGGSKGSEVDKEQSDVNPTHSHLESRRDWGVAAESLANAYATVDLLQGAAAHGAIEEPANNESLARVLSVVREQLEDVRVCLWPQDEAADTEEDES